MAATIPAVTSGFMEKAERKCPFARYATERVEPQVGQEKPMTVLKAQDGARSRIGRNRPAASTSNAIVP